MVCDSTNAGNGRPVSSGPGRELPRPTLDNFSRLERSQRESLPDVTLCCVDCTERAPWAVQALVRSLHKLSFGDALFFADRATLQSLQLPDGVRGVEIEPLRSIEAYSEFMLKSLGPHIRTSHVLVIQWDGFVLNPAAWCADFLAYDYIGAPWRHIPEPYSVGNGGFSLRSRRLIDMLAEPAFVPSHPEDLAICRTHRDALERRGIRFAPVALANRFAVEDGLLRPDAFGFHGAQHLPQVLGAEALLAFVRTLTPRALHSHFFGEFLHNIRDAAARDAAVRPAYVAFNEFLARAVESLQGSAALSPQSLGVCKALIRYGQYDTAARLLHLRRLAKGPWEPKLWLRLKLKSAFAKFTGNGL